MDCHDPDRNQRYAPEFDVLIMWISSRKNLPTLVEVQSIVFLEFVKKINIFTELQLMLEGDITTKRSTCTLNSN